MAITDDSIVMLTLTSTNFTHASDFTAQPPINGIAYGVGEGSTCSVLWSNGQQSTAVPVAILDEIETADGPTRTLFGQSVVIAGSSPAYEGVVVDVFSRNGGDSSVIVKSLSSGVYREVLSADVTPVPGH